MDVASVLELDDDGETLNLVAAAGLPALGPIQMTVSESGKAGYTLRSGEPVIVEDLASETRFAASPVLLELGVVSCVGIAIEDHDRPFGVLNAYTRERRVFSDDEVGFLTSVATLITVAVTRDRNEEATRHAALHDPLTALPNRTLALDRLAHALARRQREGIDVAVLALDLDRFKLINDSLGHAAGDTVLLALAPRLTAAVRSTDTVARIGGDEFVVICPGIDSALEATEIAERLAAAVNRPLVVDSGEYFFTVSTGITLAAASHDTPGSLLRDADAAMYRAKERGRGRYELFDEAMRTGATARLRTEAELRRALDRSELEVWYQPVIDLVTKRPVSTEALVRWRHPERGLVAPLEFIPIAEETGLIVDIGLFVLEQACRQTALWQQADPSLGVSVNVSGHQVSNPLFPVQVASIAEHSGLRPGTLALEITESVLMAEAGSPATILDDAQARADARARRLRHRLLVADPAEVLSVRSTQDRPLLRQRPPGRRGRPRDHQGDDRHGARPRSDRGRRRRRDPRAGGVPVRLGLQPRPGLLLRATAAPGGDHGDARLTREVIETPTPRWHRWVP